MHPWVQYITILLPTGMLGKKKSSKNKQTKKKWNHIKERVRKREDVDSYWTLPLSAVMHWDLQWLEVRHHPSLTRSSGPGAQYSLSGHGGHELICWTREQDGDVGRERSSLHQIDLLHLSGLQEASEQTHDCAVNYTILHQVHTLTHAHSHTHTHRIKTDSGFIITRASLLSLLLFFFLLSVLHNEP